MFSNTTSSPSRNSAVADLSRSTTWLTCEFANATVIAVLSLIAVTGNALILAAIWRKTFARTPFQILLSGLAFTDLCTGLFAQPFTAAAILMNVGSRPRVEYVTIDVIGDSSAIYLLSITVLLITVMSVERWLHMSRRSLVTSRRCCFAVIILLLILTPAVVFRVFKEEDETYARYIYIMTMALFFFLLSYYVIHSPISKFTGLFVITNSKFKQTKHPKILADKQ